MSESHHSANAEEAESDPAVLLRELDDCITKLLSVKSQRPGTEVSLPEADISKIVQRSRALFLEQPMLLEVRAPINICGDTHVSVHCFSSTHVAVLFFSRLTLYSA
jgi:Serine-threonine protein phosphatase N-terminal domain